MIQIRCKDLTLGYETGTVIEKLSFSVNEGDYLCILGENGSGKTTLMKTLLGLLISALAAAVLLLAAILISRIFFKKDPIAAFASSFSNPGFFGVPLIVSSLASGAGAGLDAVSEPQMVGCVCGDDTVLIVMRTEQAARELQQKIDRICK